MDLGKTHIPNPKSQPESPEEYCRAIEAYLCRKNDGHLIRIVGPAFDTVRGWATRGVPMTVAERGIDRYFERYYAKGPRRRPVRVEFCEADVLDVFDEWRRAVGVPAFAEASAGEPGSAEASAGEPASAEPSAGRHESLPAHLERAVARLTPLRAGTDRAMDETVDSIVQELDAARASARGLRGKARALFLERLAALDAQLLDAARMRLSESDREALRREAEAELAPFRARMPQAAFDRSVAACMNRLLRDRARLPTLILE